MRIVVWLLFVPAVNAIVLGLLLRQWTFLLLLGLPFLVVFAFLWRSRRLAWLALFEVVWILAALPIVSTFYADPKPKARLAADQGSLAAMRSAVAIYYGQHSQTFPDHPGNYVNPSPPVFQCANLTYTYSSMTGDLKITSANDVTDCP